MSVVWYWTIIDRINIVTLLITHREVDTGSNMNEESEIFLNKPKMAYSRDAFPRHSIDRLERKLEREIREGLER